MHKIAAMRRSSAESLARTAALIALGAFAVHQLRYLVGYGDAAGSELSRQGHGYLVECAADPRGVPDLRGGRRSAASGARPPVRVVRRAPSGGPDTFGRRAGLFAAGILVVFCSQELLEGALCAGHPGGLGAVLANGGWAALPLALLVALLCALLDRGISTLEAAIAADGAAPARRRGAADAPVPRQAFLVPLSASPLAFGIARRPPPAEPNC